VGVCSGPPDRVYVIYQRMNELLIEQNTVSVREATSIQERA